MKTICLILIVSALVFISCVEEYWPKLNAEFEQILVIDGRITNEPGPYTIKISILQSLDSVPYSLDPEYDFEGISGAIVNIYSEDGSSETLTEVKPGIYKTSEEGIQGVVGKKYKISVSTPNGKLYESTYEEILQPTDVSYIDYTEEENNSFINNEEILDFGLKFHVTSTELPEEVNYLFWELEETYEYHSAYKIEYIYNGTFVDGEMYTKAPYNIPAISNQDSLFYCWKTEKVKEIFTMSTNNLSIPRIENLPLNFISHENEKLRYGYSLLVNQYSVTQNAHNYLKKIIDQNKKREGLYATQPFQIRGNISNIEDSDDPVLGYFMAASKNEGKRSFYKAPYEFERDTFRSCETLAWDLPSYPEGSTGKVLKYLLYTSNPSDYPIYLTHAWVRISHSKPVVYAIRFSAVGDGCVDCRTRGGTIKKPNFWEY